MNQFRLSNTRHKKKENSFFACEPNQRIKWRTDKNSDHLKNSKQSQSLTHKLGFYFDPKERRKIVRTMIDGYFQAFKNPEESSIQAGTFKRQCKTSQGFRKRKTTHEQKYHHNKNLSLQFRSSSNQKNYVHHPNTVEVRSLPIIEEYQYKRPQTEQRRRKLHSPLLKPKVKKSQNQFFENTSSILSVSMDERQENTPNSFIKNISYLSSTKSQTTNNNSTLNNSFCKCKYFQYSKSSSQHIIKKYNESNSGEQIFEKQLKVKKYGAQVLWEKSIFDRQLIYETQNLKKTLQKELLYKVTRKHQEQIVKKIYINEKVYAQLFKNKNEWLKDLIVEICKQLVVIKGKIINNNITMRNVCRKGQKEVYLIDWSTSAICESIKSNEGKEFVNCIPPTLKELEQNQQEDRKQKSGMKWLCQPQYLAPEIVNGLANGKIEEDVLWGGQQDFSNSSDLWSLGLLIFQIITLIPLNAKERHSIRGRTILRRGFFSMKIMDLHELYKKQKQFSKEVLRLLKRQCPEMLKLVDDKILSILQNTLKFDRKQRMKAEQIITLLK